MLSNKKTTEEMHKTTLNYLQKLRQSRSFFGKLNKIQQAQYYIAKHILKTKKPAKIMSVLNEKCKFDGKIITKADLLQKESGDFGLLLVRNLFLLLTFPFSLPMITLWSWSTRGTFNFLKTDGAILVEKIVFLYNALNQVHYSAMHYSILSSNDETFTPIFFNTPLHADELLNEPVNSTEESPETKQQHITDELEADCLKENLNSDTYLFFQRTAGSYISTFDTFFSDGWSATRKAIWKQKTAMDEAILKCETQLENQIADVTIISEAIDRFNMDARYLNTPKEHSRIEQNKKVSSLSISLSADESEEESATIEQLERNQMLRDLFELLDHYPNNLNRDLSTIDSIEEYHDALVIHHDKVVALAKLVIPSLSCLLKKVQLIEHESILNERTLS